MLDLKRMQYLEAVYRCKNFTKASEMLHVSQPAISNAINALEAELKVKLMVRNSKNVTFTCEGEQIMGRIMKILDLFRETETVIRDLSDSAEQRLRLGISYAMTRQIIPVVFSKCLELHPQAQISWDEGSMYKHIELIRSESLDIAYNGLPAASAAEGLRIIPVSIAEVYAVVHPDHPLAQIDRVPLQALCSEPLVMMDRKSRVSELMDEEFAKLRLMPNIVFNYGQIACMADMVKNGRYVGILSVANGEQAIGCEGLVLRPLWTPVTFDVGFILKEGRYLPKIGRELIRFILASTAQPSAGSGELLAGLSLDGSSGTGDCSGMQSPPERPS